MFLTNVNDVDLKMTILKTELIVYLNFHENSSKADDISGPCPMTHERACFVSLLCSQNDVHGLTATL